MILLTEMLLTFVVLLILAFVIFLLCLHIGFLLAWVKKCKDSDDLRYISFILPLLIPRVLTRGWKYPLASGTIDEWITISKGIAYITHGIT